MRKQVEYVLLGVQIFFALFFLGISISCFYSMECWADFSLPDLQGEVCLNYVNSQGLQVWEKIPSEQLGKSLIIQVNKNSPHPLLLYREDNGELYGAIYPYSCEIKKDDAFAASILMGLYSGAYYRKEQNFSQVQDYLSYFNWQLFMKDCREVENVWALNRQKIMEDIAAGTFSKKNLKN